MFLYIFLLIIGILPIIEGDSLGMNRLLISIFSFLCCIYLYKKKIYLNKPTILFAVFLVFCTIFTIFIPGKDRSIETLILYLNYFIFFITSQTLSVKENSYKKYLALVIVFSSLTLCLINFALIIFNQKISIPPMNLFYTNYGHNNLINYLLFSFPISLFFFYKEENFTKKILFALISLLFTLSIISTFSRGGLIITLFILGFFGTKIMKVKKPDVSNNKLNKVPSIFAFTLLTLVTVLFLGGYYINKLPVNNFLVKKSLRPIQISIRVGYYEQALKAFWQKPITGWGLDNFVFPSIQYQKKPLSWSLYAHNHFLQILAETGLFGGLCFLALIILILKKVLPSLQASIFSLETVFGITLVASTAHSLIDFDWQFISIFLTFWIISGYFVAKDKKYFASKYSNWIITTLGIFVMITGTMQFCGNVLIVRGYDLFKDSLYEKSEKFYLASIIVWPFKTQKYKLLADLYKQTNQKLSELKMLNINLKKDPLNYKNYIYLADYYKEQADFEKARFFYEGAVRLNPKESVNTYLTLLVITNINKIEELNKIYTYIFNIENINSDFCSIKCIGSSNEIIVENKLKKVIKSAALFNLTSRQKSKIFFWLFVLDSHHQDWRKDLDLLVTANSLSNKEYINIQKDLETLLSLKQDYKNNSEERYSYLNNYFQKREKSFYFYQQWYLGDAFYTLGLFNLHSKNYPEAIINFSKAIKINKWNDKYYIELAKIYEIRNEISKVKETLELCIYNNKESNQCKDLLDNKRFISL